MDSEQDNSPVLVSPSRIATYVDCPLKHDFVYNLELTPKIVINKAKFDKGNYFHELTHVYNQMLKAGMVPGSDAILAAILSRVRNDISDISDPSLIPVYNIVLKRIVDYIKRQSPNIDKDMQILGIEQELIAPVTDEFSLFGYADLIYKRFQKVVIRDTKTGEKAWSRGEAEYSNQLLFYALIWYLVHSEVAVAEISFINTKDYARKIPTDDQLFARPTVTYTERELKVYFEQICNVIEKMLHSEPFPQYGQHCRYCSFQTPCYIKRKGLDPAREIEAHYVKRESRHRAFTDQHANGNSPD